jgi:methanogenic corrinoid protein MtbC1
MADSEIDSLNQSEVEQATGLSREVLRKWELRYGYPVPVRGERGERRYGMSDVRKLTLIKQLIGQGLRPRHLMACPMDELQTLLQAVPVVALERDDHAAVQELHACLRPGVSPHALKLYLAKLIADTGLAHFVHHHLPVFNLAVGDAWAKGYLGIHAEHLYTESVRALVLGLVADVRLGGTTERKPPRLLLTTPPGELHGLGVLALQSALVLEGADCVSLGTQTPVLDVVRAVQEWGVTVVAISTSSALQPAAARNYVQALRRVLPEQCRLWVGGQGAQALTGDPVVGIEVMQTLSQAVDRWKDLSSVQTEAINLT